MIGTDKERKAYKALEDDLQLLKKNISFVGSVDLLRAKYAKGYKKLMNKIDEDLRNYETAVFEGYKTDTVIDERDLKDVWGDRSKKITRIILRSQNASEIQKLYEDYLLNLQEIFNGLIYVSFEEAMA